MGYHLAGFEVVGVDIEPQPRYPFLFVLMDALEALHILIAGGCITDNLGNKWYLDDFTVIHASPPCQAYSIAANNGSGQGTPKLIGVTRQLLKETGKVYVIENVAGAPLKNPTQICGASFGLGISGFDLNRHRYFESNVFILSMPCQHRRGQTIGVYGNGTNSWHREKFGRCITVDEMRRAMGIDWMTRAELSQAVPPAYTKWLGERLLNVMKGDFSQC